MNKDVHILFLTLISGRNVYLGKLNRCDIFLMFNSFQTMVPPGVGVGIPNSEALCGWEGRLTHQLHRCGSRL